MSLSLAGIACAGDLVFRTYSIPKASELRTNPSFEEVEKNLRERILKLIPLGIAEEDAKPLLKKHLPPKTQERFNMGGVASELPARLEGKAYVCYRIIDEAHPLRLGRRWIEVLFFFEDGKLREVYVTRGGVAA